MPVKQKPLREVIVIVPEGKTEQEYIKALKSERGYEEKIGIKCEPDRSKANRSGKNSLSNLIDYAKDAEKDFSSKAGYLGVWIICDTDENSEHESKMTNWLHPNKDKRNIAITGPAIEYWFLLHYEKGRKAKVNGADSAVAELKKIIDNYRKGNIPKGLIGNTDEAVRYAKQNNKVPRKGCECLSGTNFSQIPHLIEYLDTVVSRLPNN